MNDIESEYKVLGKTSFYDGMITCSTVPGKAICKLIWNMNKEQNNRYLNMALSGIPKNFGGRLLEVPVGTGILTMPLYKALNQADITCLDYSNEMMNNARMRAEYENVKNIRFVQGDVGCLPFENDSFDVVLSLNGFHAFPDKNAAYKETRRVLKDGGIFCGCFYVKDENKRTDWFKEKLYTPKGYFTPPYETKETLYKKLSSLYKKVKLETVESIACFTCLK